MVSYKDALELEHYEKMQMRHRNTRRAIEDTYGEKSPTKKRRKLKGKRKWKNKQAAYAPLRGQMMKNEFNKRKKVTKILEKAYTDEDKQKAKQRQKHSLY